VVTTAVAGSTVVAGIVAVTGDVDVQPAMRMPMKRIVKHTQNFFMSSRIDDFWIWRFLNEFLMHVVVFYQRFRIFHLLHPGGFFLTMIISSFEIPENSSALLISSIRTGSPSQSYQGQDFHGDQEIYILTYLSEK
jgi:hypothetical protein